MIRLGWFDIKTSSIVFMFYLMFWLIKMLLKIYFWPIIILFSLGKKVLRKIC